MILAAVYHVVFMMVLLLFVSYFHLPKTLYHNSLYIFPAIHLLPKGRSFLANILL